MKKIFFTIKQLSLLKILYIQYLHLTLENSNTQFQFLIARTNSSVPEALRISLGEKTLNILNLNLLNILVGRAKLLGPWTISSRSLKLSFYHFGQNSKVLKFERFFRLVKKKKIRHKSFWLLVRCFFEKDGTCKMKTDK